MEKAREANMSIVNKSWLTHKIYFFYNMLSSFSSRTRKSRSLSVHLVILLIECHAAFLVTAAM
jgi:hypothetical protein